MSNTIAPIEGTNNIRYADFVRIIVPATSTLPASTICLSTAPNTLTINDITFNALGSLMGIGKIQRDIKSTANQTNITVVGIDPAFLGEVLALNFKGSQITMWKGFFDTNNQLITTGGSGGLYQYFFGYVNAFNISEQWMEEIRMMVGTISISAANVQMILQSRIAGRFTNNPSWQYYNANDTSMNRVAVISTLTYPFGKTA
jgi:hypothetical protein